MSLIARVDIMTAAAVARWTQQFLLCPEEPSPVRALTYRNSLRGASKAVAVYCDDYNTYVIKGRHLLHGRVACNEQIVGFLAEALGAPVPQVRVVDVPSELIRIEPKLRHFDPGPAHGSMYVPAVLREERKIQYETVEENRARFVRLAVLYSWAVAGDHQLFYENDPPRLVHSFDHGYFFRGGDWEIAKLAVMLETMPIKMLDPFFDAVGFSMSELRAARQALDNITEQDIAVAVRRPPEGWGLTGDERLAMAEFLWLRRSQLLAAISL